MADPSVTPPPDWPSLAALGTLLTAFAAIIGALSKNAFDYLKDRSATRDNADFRSALVAQVQTLSQRLGTYEEQIDLQEGRLLDLTSANKRLTTQFETATRERDGLMTRIESVESDNRLLVRRVAQLERRNALYLSLLTTHGIPIPPDGDDEEF